MECLAKYNSTGPDGWRPSHAAAECDANCYPDGLVATNTIANLKTEFDKIKQNGLDNTKPFFIAAGMKRPHLTWFAPQEYFDMYPNNDVTLATHRMPPVVML